MRNRQTFPATVRDDARIRAIRGGDPSLPDGPALGLVGVDRTDPDVTTLPTPDTAAADGPWQRPAVVTAVACKTATAEVDDYRVAVGKVLPGWGAGTVLDAHVDTERNRVWLRLPHQPRPPCTCGHGCEDPGDTRPTIPGVDKVAPGAVEVQTKHRVKLAKNLVGLLGGTRDSGAITATTVDDLDAVLLVGAADYLRRLLPDLTEPLPDNVIAMPDTRTHNEEQTS